MRKFALSPCCKAEFKEASDECDILKCHNCERFYAYRKDVDGFELLYPDIEDSKEDWK
ncbi:hypothetical protein [Nitrosopumilus sp. S6]